MQKPMWAVAKQWGLPLTFDEVIRACQDCVVCSKRDLRCILQQQGEVARGPTPLDQWQVDFICPLTSSESYWYVVTCVDTAIGFLAAFPAIQLDQWTVKKGLECHFAAYGCLEVIESDQGIHFMGRQVQQWLQELDVTWWFHTPYNLPPQGGRHH